MQNIPRHDNKIRISVKKDKQHAARNKMKNTKYHTVLKSSILSYSLVES